MAQLTAVQGEVGNGVGVGFDVGFDVDGGLRGFACAGVRAGVSV